MGIGINCSTEDFPDAVADVAGALHGCDVRRCALCAAVTEELCGFIEQLSTRLWMEEYRRDSLVLGRTVKCIQGTHTYFAVAEAIDDAGGLVVRLEDGTRQTLHSGEISIRLTEQ